MKAEADALGAIQVRFFNVGQTREQAALYLVRLARRLGEPVEADFNGTPMLAHPGDLIEDVLREFTVLWDVNAAEKERKRAKIEAETAPARQHQRDLTKIAAWILQNVTIDVQAADIYIRHPETCQEELLAVLEEGTLRGVETGYVADLLKELPTFLKRCRVVPQEAE